MIFLIVLSISIAGFIIGKYFFKKWFNPLSLYVSIWYILITLYEWKLLPYVSLIPLAWFFIFSSFLSFLLGIATTFFARNYFFHNFLFEKKTIINIEIFKDGGSVVKYLLIILSLISVFSGIHHWLVLINMFGSIPAVFLNATTIYNLHIHREIKGFIPYLPIIGYVAIFLAGIYTSYKGKFSFLTFLPFIGIVLKELATVGRSGMLLALLEFLFTFIFFRYLLNDDLYQRFKFSKKSAWIASILILILFISSATLVRITRVSGEYYSGASRELRQLRGNLVITPSIYLYFSSDIGVLSEYLKFQNEENKFGQNSLLPLYDFLAKFELIHRVPDVQKGYFIPMWVNTGTFIRELHADFGVAGVFIIPFLLGVMITWFWYRFFLTQSIISLLFLVYLNLIIGFSFLQMITRVTYWSTSLFILFIIILLLKNISKSFFHRCIEQNK